MTLIDRQFRTQTEAPPATDKRISRAWSLGLSASWIAVLVLAFVLEPAPTGTEPVWAGLVGTAMLVGIVATFTGITRRLPWAAPASVLASTAFLAGVFLCPATGHHAFGLWWIGEFAASLGLVALSTLAYFRTR